MNSRSSMFPQMTEFSSLLRLNNIHCMDISHLFNIECQWTMDLCPYPGYCGSAVMRMKLQACLQDTPFISFGWIPRCVITGSTGSSLCNVRKLSTLFHDSCTIFHSTNGIHTFDVFPILTNTCFVVVVVFVVLSLFHFLIKAIPKDVGFVWITLPWWLVGLNIFSQSCWPLVYFLWSQEIKFSPHSQIQSVPFVSFLHINTFSAIRFANTFSPSVGCLFLLSVVEETILSSLCSLGILAKDQVAMYVRVYFQALYSDPLVCVPIFMPAPPWLV